MITTSPKTRKYGDQKNNYGMEYEEPIRFVLETDKKCDGKLKTATIGERPLWRQNIMYSNDEVRPTCLIPKGFVCAVHTS
jgi:hypothetical protein